MPRRGENIRKRKDGRWEGRYKKGRRADNSIIYGYVYGKTYGEVKEKLKGDFVACPTRLGTYAPPLFRDVVGNWFLCIKSGKKEATLLRYEYLIQNHIVPQLGEIPVDKIDSNTLSSFVNEKVQRGRLNGSGGLSGTYIRSILLIVFAALKYQSERSGNPVPKQLSYASKEHRKDFSVLSKKEQTQLELNLLDDFNLTGAGILISIHTGLRIGEICALKWENIEFEQSILHVRHTVSRTHSNSDQSNGKSCFVIGSPKTKASYRDIPISAKLYSILEKAKSISGEQFVISETNTFVNPRTYEYRFHKSLKDSDIRQINYHVLRHTFATRCIEAGVDVKTLSEILGHANVAITLNTYVHSSMELKRQQLEKLESFCL